MISTVPIRATRGDSISIPIEYELLTGPTYRAQLRKNPDSVNFLVLAIVGTNIVITTEQSDTLAKDTYYIELEENNEGVVTTVQLTAMFVREDITRTYGDPPPPAWETDESIEVAEMITRNLYIRKVDNSLVDVETLVLDSNAATEAATEIAASVSAAEGLRVTAEGLRVTAEGLRVTAESVRVSSEGLRATSEDSRELAEAARELAEDARELAEDAREANTAAAIVDAETATTAANEAAAYANNALSIAPHIFEGYANLPAGVETTIPGTSLTPVLNLRPVNVQVFHDGELKTVAARYVVNGDNYDVLITSSVDLFGAEITILGTLLKLFVALFTTGIWSDNSKWDDVTTWAD